MKFYLYIFCLVALVVFVAALSSEETADNDDEEQDEVADLNGKHFISVCTRAPLPYSFLRYPSVMLVYFQRQR